MRLKYNACTYVSLLHKKATIKVQSIVLYNKTVVKNTNIWNETFL